MNAVEALIAARAAGVELALDGDNLALRAAVEPTTAVLDELSRHKPRIVALLRRGRDGLSGEDWWAFFEERAAVVEFDGGLLRAEAEARAFECCIVEWLNRNCGSSPPGRCVSCGEVEQRHDPLQPFGLEQIGSAWLHLRCWQVWHEKRKGEAVAVLTEILTSG